MSGICVSSRPACRGYAIVALDNPKYGGNIGAAMRAAFCLDARAVVIAGQRFRKEQPDTPQAWRHIPTIEVGNIMDAVPYGCTPVAVDLLPGATPLPRFVHPERAYYIFGAEDATLSDDVVSRCVHKLVIPSRMCLNLGATVNVVLYDRAAKTSRQRADARRVA